MRSIAIIFAVCWVAFWIYWIISAFGSKRSIVTNTRRFFAIRIVLLVLAILLLHIGNGVSQSSGGHFLGTNKITLAIGIILFLLGIALAVWARICLGKNWGMPMTQKQDPQLVTTGPYRYIRHPIYTGLLLMALGSALDVNIYWLVVFIVSCVYFVYSAFAEEKTMGRQFPKVYATYKSKTKMLVPFIF